MVLKTHVPNLLISWINFWRKVFLIDLRETFIRTKVQYPFVPFWRIKWLSIRFFSVFSGTKCSILVFFCVRRDKKIVCLTNSACNFAYKCVLVLVENFIKSKSYFDIKMSEILLSKINKTNFQPRPKRYHFRIVLE